MVSLKLKVAFGLLAAAVLGTAAQATPTVTMTSSIVAAFDPSTTAYTQLASLPDFTNTVNNTLLYQVNFSFQITGATASEPYLTQLSFDLTPSALPGGTLGGLIPTNGATAPSGLSAVPTARNGYKGNALPAWLVDSGNGDGTTVPGPAFLKNTDPNPAQFLSILLDLGSGPFDQIPVDASDNPTGAPDPRSILAQSAPFVVGRAFFFWDGKEKQTLDLSNLATGIWSTTSGQIKSSPGVMNAPATLTFGGNIGAVPEPASMGVLAMGCLALLARRRKSA